MRRETDFLKKMLVFIFSSLEVRSRDERESALSSQRLRESVNATTGNLSFLSNMLTNDNQMFLSCKTRERERERERE